MRLFMVQYGDYAQALDARARGDPETYRAQYYSLDAVDALLGRGKALVVGLDARPSDERRGAYHLVTGRFEPRSSGLRYRFDARRSARAITALAREFAPTHAVIRAPGWVLTDVAAPLAAAGVAVLPLLADYFPVRGMLDRLRLRSQVRLLNSPAVAVCANHNYPACMSMVAAGVRPDKVVPWDWPPPSDPGDVQPKERGGGPVRLLYAGAVSEAKGVCELVDAMDALHLEDCVLTVCGTGPDLDGLRAVASTAVEFLGLTPNRTVRDLMARAHLVVVPSRHEYPEGLPNVIYEAFEARTPVVCSDHPSFVMRLVDGVGCRVFRAGDAVDMARAVREAVAPEAYAALSRTTLEAWLGIQCPVSFGDLLEQWGRWTREGGELDALRHSVASVSAGAS